MPSCEPGVIPKMKSLLFEDKMDFKNGMKVFP